MNYGIVYRKFMLLSLQRSIKDFILACLFEQQQFWRQKEIGQFLSIDIVQKTKSMYIHNFKMVHFEIYLYSYIHVYFLIFQFLKFSICMLLITLYFRVNSQTTCTICYILVQHRQLFKSTLNLKNYFFLKLINEAKV